MSKSLRNLRFLQRRHRLTGCDMDYLLKLDAEQLAWLESFARKYYNGEGEENPERKKEANHRRYMAKSADAMSKATGRHERIDLSPDDSDIENNADDLTPERILLLKEHPPTPPRHLRSVERSPDETVKKET